MKKIAIITITSGLNYGNRLQNYALSKYINSLGLEVETLNNNGKEIIIKRWLKNIYNFILRRKYLIRKNNFAKFNKNIKFSKFYISNDNIPKLIENKYYAFIAGSDQIWNLNYKQNSIVNFLGFVKNKKKISYAASFGLSEIPNTYDKRINDWLREINSLSVREERGKEIIKEISGREDACVLIDPTMLLSSNEWEKVLAKPNNFKVKKYILNYFLGELSEERKKEINRIAKENNCEIINILDKNDIYYTYGPSEFLYLEKNAFLICTDSFHSAVFAVIYDRPFVIFEREQVGLNNMNSRLETLISKFNLKNRKYNGEKITEENLNHDYSEAYKILEVEREKSKKFLEKALDIEDNK